MIDLPSPFLCLTTSVINSLLTISSKYNEIEFCSPWKISVDQFGPSRFQSCVALNYINVFVIASSISVSEPTPEKLKLPQNILLWGALLAD